MRSTKSKDREITLAEAAKLSGLLEEGFPTHKVSLYGLRCYYNKQHSTVWMRWQIFDFLIIVVTQLHNALTLLTCFLIPTFEPPGFPLKILDEYRLFYREGNVDIESGREREVYYENKD